MGFTRSRSLSGSRLRIGIQKRSAILCGSRRRRKICARLGLKAAAVSSQVIQRDRHAFYLATLATIASTLDKIATEIRHLQRTEVREAEEFFSEKQKGS